jgi:PKHD-type hydroxylase
MNLKYNFWFFRNAIPPHECGRIIKHGLSYKDQEGVTGIKGEVSNNKKLRDSSICFIDDPWIYRLIMPYVQVANKNAGWNFQWDHTESIQFTKYKLNQHYSWHTDSHTEPYDDPGKINHGKLRKLSCCVALNNSTDYKGGELEIASDDKEGNKVPLKCEAIKYQGSIVVFPSFMWHRVTPVTEGLRYSLVTWSIGWPFK